MRKTSKKLLMLLGMMTVLGMTACGKTTAQEEQDNTVVEDTQTEGSQTEDLGNEENVEGEAQTEETQVVEPQIDDAQQAELESIQAAVAEAYGEDYLPNMDVDTTTLQESYGLSGDLYDAIVAQIPMISFNVDTFVAVHPTEGNKDAVVEALTAYREKLINDSVQYPVNLPKIQASVVHEAGDYVFFVMLGSVDDMIEDEDERLQLFTEQNQIAIDTIDSVTK